MRATHRLLELASLGLLGSLLIGPALAQIPEGLSVAALESDAWPAFGLANHAADTIGQAFGAPGQAKDDAAGQGTRKAANQSKMAKAEPQLEEAASPLGAVGATTDMSWQTADVFTPMPLNPASGAPANPALEEAGPMIGGPTGQYSQSDRSGLSSPRETQP